MADKEIGALTAATTLAGTELAHIVQGANSRKVTTTRVISEVTHSATGKTTPIDADEMAVVDTEASNALKKLTWANIKATLKTYFDTLYTPAGGGIADAPNDTKPYVRKSLGWDDFTDDMALKAPLDSPAFTGNPQAPTPSTGDNDTSVSTTAFVQTTVNARVSAKITVASSAPGSPATNDVWIDTT